MEEVRQAITNLSVHDHRIERFERQIQVAMMDNLNEDTLMVMSRFLDPKDLTSLSLTCKRLGAKSEKYGNCSLVEDVARRLVEETSTYEDRVILRRYASGGETNFGLYKRWLMVRFPKRYSPMNEGSAETYKFGFIFWLANVHVGYEHFPVRGHALDMDID